MAKKAKKQASKPHKQLEQSKAAHVEDSRAKAFGRLNYIGLALGLVVIGFGYILLASGSITAAPILLVLGYCVIMPTAIIIDSDKWMGRLSRPKSATSHVAEETAGP